MANSRNDVRGIPLDLHAPAAPVTLLPPPQLVIDKFLIYVESRRQAREKGKQGFSVRFSRCEVAQHKCSILPDMELRWSFCGNTAIPVCGMIR
jgi:hypothetical protein